MKITDKIIDACTFLIEGYLRGKEVLPIARRIMDPLFSINISSYLFERFYFKYQWLDIIDYKSILSFFIKGNFIIPVSIFFVVHFSIRAISIFIFEKINGRVLQFFKKSLSVKGESIAFYKRSQAIIAERGIDKLASKMKKLSLEVQETWLFIFKVILISILYFSLIPEYGALLLILMLIILLVLLVATWMCYMLFAFLPDALKNLKEVSAKAIEDNLSGF